MKTRGSWAKKVVGAVLVVFGLLLLGGLRAKLKHPEEASRGVSRLAIKGIAGDTRGKHDSGRAEVYGKLPLSSEENVGQAAKDVHYISHGSGYQLLLTAQGATLVLRAPIPHNLSPVHRFETLKALRQASRARTRTAIRMRLDGANPAARASAFEKLAKKTNYFIGNDPKNWHTDVASYGRVKYEDIYPGVDLVFYGNQRKLEYDFIVRPGADPTAIRLSLEGGQRLRLASSGDLVMRVPGGE